MDKGDFTIIISTLNRLEPLKITVDSILKQKILPKKLIIVDQSDNTNIKNWFNKIKLPFSKKYIYQKEKNTCKARNLGIKNTKTKYISFLGDDVISYIRIIILFCIIILKSIKILWELQDI